MAFIGGNHSLSSSAELFRRSSFRLAFPWEKENPKEDGWKLKLNVERLRGTLNPFPYSPPLEGKLCVGAELERPGMASVVVGGAGRVCCCSERAVLRLAKEAVPCARGA